MVLVVASPEVKLDGWCEGGVGQQSDDGGGCSPMRDRYERVESPRARFSKSLNV